MRCLDSGGFAEHEGVVGAPHVVAAAVVVMDEACGKGRRRALLEDNLLHGRE